MKPFLQLLSRNLKNFLVFLGSPKPSPSRQNSRDSAEEELEYFYDDGTKSRNPVRRSNSSPEMSASWKNPFLHQKTMLEGEENKGADEDNIKKNKMYSKDMRVSCEAIPEEIAGSGEKFIHSRVFFHFHFFFSCFITFDFVVFFLYKDRKNK